MKVQCQSSRAVDISEGFYIKVRIDEFPYRGTTQEDEWISFSIADTRFIMQSDTEWNNSWCCLIRGNGGGAAAEVQSFITTVGSSFTHRGSTTIQPTLDNDREIYEFEIAPSSASTRKYDVKVNGSVVEGADAVSAHIEKFETPYIGITLHSGVSGGKGSFTILEQGTSSADAETPEGNDFQEPEENHLIFADMMDSSDIAANQPVFLWDNTKSSFLIDPKGADMSLAPTASGGYHCAAIGPRPYFAWAIDKDLTYEAKDFPVFAMMLKNFVADDGHLYYCAGDTLTAKDTCMTSWSQWDANAQWYGENEEYCYVLVDLSTMEDWKGRINCVQPTFAVDYTDEEQAEWDIEFMGLFRSIDEALAYGENYNETVIIPGAEADTDDAADTDAADTDAADTDAADTDAADTDAATDADTDADTDAATDAATGDETKAEEDDGCASVVGMGAVAIIAAAAAAVVLKKKD